MLFTETMLRHNTDFKLQNVTVLFGFITPYSMFRSFADLQKPQRELDGKACAAVGQNGLMALYDLLFSQVNTMVSVAHGIILELSFIS